MPRAGASSSPALVTDPAALLAAVRLVQRAGGTVESTVTGASMGATLPAGARIRLDADGAAVAPGLVVVLRAGPVGLIVHRVVGLGRGAGGGWLLTRGDGLALCDTPTPRRAVIGAVTTADRGDGWKAVPPAASRPLPTRVGMTLHRGLMLGALALSPRLARWIAGVSFRLAGLTSHGQAGS